MQKRLRILFAGSPAIAVPALEAAVALCDEGEGFALASLLTNPDTPKGRNGKLEPTECAAALERLHSIPILKPEKLDGEVRTQVQALEPDLLVSFAYGKIFGPKFLDLFPMGGINVHPSLLPKYRGPTPIPAAIINGEAETGITIQRLALEMDSGDILAQEKVPLNGWETTASLSETMAKKAAMLLPEVLKDIGAAGAAHGRAQDHGAASYCSLIAKADGMIDWGMGATEINARIRAYTPWPLSWTTHGDQQLLILKAKVAHSQERSDQARPGEVLGKDKNMGILIQTGEGVLAVSELQYRTKKPLEWQAFLNGARNFIGETLGV